AARAARRRAGRASGLRPTGRFPRRSGVRGVELREARVIAPDVIVLWIELERLLVFLERPREVAGRLEGDREVVVRARVLRIGRDDFFEPEGGLAPVTLLRDFRAERDLGARGTGPASDRAGGGQSDSQGGGGAAVQAFSNGAHYKKAAPGGDS